MGARELAVANENLRSQIMNLEWMLDERHAANARLIVEMGQSMALEGDADGEAGYALSSTRTSSVCREMAFVLRHFGLLRNLHDAQTDSRKQKAQSFDWAFCFETLGGSPTWARTRDLRINSPALYQLSYRGTSAAEKRNYMEAAKTCQHPVFIRH
jgi:hypothetical protein